ncbi:MAG: hypothetical protein H6900_13540 [Rhodobacter sp.]|uniref:hypothetical protein n=1 Tax=Pararhodobacter sp. TaxID=2127056 RepID=UPI002D1BEA29|nr:hypothetical protein [Pararhodobacter sp.]MCC0074301.1 hypothetical protein [Rhodobacter sp.]HPD91632.1 hypothetical protein [Pararhodobacter sp.]
MAATMAAIMAVVTVRMTAMIVIVAMPMLVPMPAVIALVIVVPVVAVAVAPAFVAAVVVVAPPGIVAAAPAGHGFEDRPAGAPEALQSTEIEHLSHLLAGRPAQKSTVHTVTKILSDAIMLPQFRQKSNM